LFYFIKEFCIYW